MSNIIYTVLNNNFEAVGIYRGDVLTFEDTTPQEGDFTLLQDNGKQQLVQLIGKDYLDNYILCNRYTSYPHAVSLYIKVNLYGKMVRLHETFNSSYGRQNAHKDSFKNKK